MNSVIVRLAISSDEMLRLYAGTARDAIAVDEAGRTVRFPADILRPHVSHDGVHGRFRISFDKEGRFQDIARIDAS